MRLLGAATAVVLLWGSAFVGVRVALDGVTPGQLALARYLVASLVFVVLVGIRGGFLPPSQDVKRLVVAGFVGIALYNLALNTGQQTVSPGVASLIVNTVPIWTAILSVVMLGDRIEARGWLGAAIAFGGVVLIATQDGEPSGGDQSGPNWGFDRDVWLVIAAAVCQALFFVVIKPLLARHPPLQVTAWVVWIGTVFLVPFSPGMIVSLRESDAVVVGAIAFLGAGPAALAYLAWSYVLSELAPGRAANILFLVPVATIVVGWLVLRDIPSTMELAGGLFAVLGVAVSRGKPKCDA